jgi:hypothetical protein
MRRNLHHPVSPHFSLSLRHKAELTILVCGYGALPWKAKQPRRRSQRGTLGVICLSLVHPLVNARAQNDIEAMYAQCSVVCSSSDARTGRLASCRVHSATIR